ncbi:MAG: tryptophanase, partial [Clostridia bacterium]|nr:tryptophanase [Clostridia bacterium]
MSEIKFYSRPEVPVEMHKVKIVQKLNLLPAKERLKKMQEAGFNTFMLHNGDIFMDMLTDSGVNAMSDNQQAAMLRADDAYAGSETFYRMEKKLTEIFGINHLLPTHQGRACEHIIAQHFVKPDSCVIMNYHFTTSKAHVTRLGGRVEELVKDEGLIVKSDLPFKGNIDLDKVKACIEREGADNIAFLRLEAGTNLIGGQPISYENMKEATELAKSYGITTVLDASLLQDNLY